MVKRIEKIETKTNQNDNDLKKVQRFTIKVNAENFLKRVIEIPIVTHYTVL